MSRDSNAALNGTWFYISPTSGRTLAYAQQVMCPDSS